MDYSSASDSPFLLPQWNGSRPFKREPFATGDKAVTMEALERHYSPEESCFQVPLYFLHTYTHLLCGQGPEAPSSQHLSAASTDGQFWVECVEDRVPYEKHPETPLRQVSSKCYKCSVQLLSHVRLFATPWTSACQASLSITNSQSLLKLMSIEWVMPSNHLILCRPHLLLPSTFPSIRVFSEESVLCIRWPKYWSFSFSISPSSEYSRLISFRINWLDLLVV